MSDASPLDQTLLAPDLKISAHDAEKCQSSSREPPPIGELTVAPPLVGQADADFPDGGLRAWSVVAGAFCASFITWGINMSWGSFASYYQYQQLAGYTASEIGWIGSSQLFFVYIGMTISGRLFDRGYLRQLLFFGSLWTVFCFFMISISTKYWHFLLCQGIGSGFGQGTLFLTAVSCVNQWFRRRRGLAQGVLAVGSCIGGVILPIMQNQLLVHSKIGFGWTIRAMAFIILFMGICTNLLLVSRLPPRKGGALVDFSVFKAPKLAFFAVGASFSIAGLYMPIFLLSSYAVSLGFSQELAFYLLAIFNGASIVGRLGPPWLADKIGCLNVVLACNTISLILILCFSAVQSRAALLVYSILIGISTGAYVALTPSAIASLTTDMRMIGITSGMSFLIVSVGGLSGTPINGAVITAQGGKYLGSSLFSGGVLAIGISLMICSRRLQAKSKGTWKV